MMKYVAFVQGWSAVIAIAVIAAVAMLLDGWLRKSLWYIVMLIAVLAIINEHRRK